MEAKTTFHLDEEDCLDSKGDVIKSSEDKKRIAGVILVKSELNDSTDGSLREGKEEKPKSESNKNNGTGNDFSNATNDPLLKWKLSAEENNNDVVIICEEVFFEHKNENK